jgi:hypothetical protein
MMGQQARASVRVMRLWKPHDPGRSCLHCTIQHYVTNETDSQNDGALVPDQMRVVRTFSTNLKAGLRATACGRPPSATKPR